jgi:zinc transport system substrate-binding protein
MKTLNRTLICLIILMVALAVTCGCTQPERAPEGERLVVLVTIPPQEEMVKAVAGDRAEVLVLVPPGSDPHTYEPTPRQIQEASGASMYLTLGKGLLPVEDNLQTTLKGLNPGLVIVDTSSGVDYLGSTSNPDPHVWLSLKNAITMVDNTRDAFIRVDPSHAQDYGEGSEAYIAEIKELDDRISGYFSGKENHTIMVSHDAWAYFARDYSLSIIPIEQEGKEPTPRELAALVDRARESGISVVFADAIENPRDAEVIAAEIGGRVETVNPLAADYLANMDRMAQAFAGSLS